MITLDATVVIAHLDPANALHRSATEYLRVSAAEGFVMHSLNLAEVLVGGVRTGRGEEMQADLQAMGISEAEPVEGEALRLATLRATTGLKLPHCCALGTALSTSSTLATFDAALIKAARQRHVDVAST